MYCVVKKGISDIPHAGEGLFAKKSLKKNSFVGVYKGYKKKIDELDMDEQIFSAKIDGDHAIVGTGLGAKINDIVEFRQLSPLESYKIIYQRGSFPKHKGKSYNVYLCKLGKDKVGIIALKDIEEGEELYVSYGVDYWTPLFQNKGYLNKKLL